MSAPVLLCKIKKKLVELSPSKRLASFFFQIRIDVPYESYAN